MSIALPTDVEDLYDAGHIAKSFLVRFDLPGQTVAYVNGPRPISYNGTTYIPNRFLQHVGGDSTLGYSVPTKTIAFSNVPTTDADDAIASIENYDYQNAPVVISTLVVDPISGEIAGVAESAVYEIAQVEFNTSEADEKGERFLTLTIDLDPPGRAIREQTGAKRSLEEQQFDNDASDTGAVYASTVSEWTKRWGRV